MAIQIPLYFTNGELHSYVLSYRTGIPAAAGGLSIHEGWLSGIGAGADVFVCQCVCVSCVMCPRSGASVQGDVRGGLPNYVPSSASPDLPVSPIPRLRVHGYAYGWQWMMTMMTMMTMMMTMLQAPSTGRGIS